MGGAPENESGDTLPSPRSHENHIRPYCARFTEDQLTWSAEYRPSAGLVAECLQAVGRNLDKLARALQGVLFELFRSDGSHCPRRLYGRQYREE